ncbi:hypothetical protein EVU96_11740 [Bacillus infantis]|uniref:hypothetical protein n=1 Tax=Bacillus infantis TaxID=324767 RepID=UPI00101E0B67|nr:hypothetical protein [Bacillus infantis]RYI29647.1 hypothetical protein EVU96_11740 [Bacillus infantis]
MNSQLNKPKGIGQILDLTFSLARNKFGSFTAIFLILVGPVYLLQALFSLAAGQSFFRDINAGGSWFEQIAASFETDTAGTDIYAPGSLFADLGLVFAGLLSALMIPLAGAAVLIAVDQVRKGMEFTPGMVIKKAFRRFWPILGTSILFSIITFAVIILPIVFISITGIFGSMVHPVIGIIFAGLFLLAFAVGVGYLLTRWSFYFGYTVLEKKAPGFSESWTLTQGRSWHMLLIYALLFLIIGIVSFAIEMTAGLLLGGSVLFDIILNLATLVTTCLYYIGFSVMYFDLKGRQGGDDLNSMIEDYSRVQ